MLLTDDEKKVILDCLLKASESYNVAADVARKAGERMAAACAADFAATCQELYDRAMREGNLALLSETHVNIVLAALRSRAMDLEHFARATNPHSVFDSVARQLLMASTQIGALSDRLEQVLKKRPTI